METFQRLYNYNEQNNEYHFKRIDDWKWTFTLNEFKILIQENHQILKAQFNYIIDFHFILQEALCRQANIDIIRFILSKIKLHKKHTHCIVFVLKNCRFPDNFDYEDSIECHQILQELLCKHSKHLLVELKRSKIITPNSWKPMINQYLKCQTFRMLIKNNLVIKTILLSKYLFAKLIDFLC